MGVVQTLVKTFQLPQTLIDAFLINFWKGIDREKDNPSSKYNHKLKMIATFIKKLIESNLFDPKIKYQVWVDLCNSNAVHNSSVQELLKVIQKVGETAKQAEN